jgi:putative SOS response-associated peptidase YedK
MCARYDPVTSPERFKQVFGTKLPPVLVGTPQADQKSTKVFPGGWAPIVRATPHGLARGVIETQKDDDADESHAPDHEAVWAVFGLIPQWAKDTKICRSTYNARSETVADKPSFKAAWARHQHCIVPAESITEPDYATGKAVPTRIACADGLPMGIAGLWSTWTNEQGQQTHSFTMLTINAQDHAVMNRFHKPDDEKRMVVILPRGCWKDWLLASPDSTPTAARCGFLRGYPAQRLKCHLA